jgi:uncharacterized protein with PQ loop repeat
MFHTRNSLLSNGFITFAVQPTKHNLYANKNSNNLEVSAWNELNVEWCKYCLYDIVIGVAQNRGSRCAMDDTVRVLDQVFNFQVPNEIDNSTRVVLQLCVPSGIIEDCSVS